ncbi:MAG: hypothetical protein HC904_00925 [Blastochloris sp.]|nr:hypothetical protein [Blastochloris sp.]
MRDHEPLARYILTASFLYKDNRAGTPLRPNSWIPHPSVELSVFRIEGWQEEQVIAQGEKVASEREAKHRNKILGEGKEYPEDKTTFRYHGRGEIIAREVRSVGLEVLPKEPPPRHADVVNWPPLTGNKKHDESSQMAFAMKLNAKAHFIAAA